MVGNGDVLGDKGREVFCVCVKVIIYGRLEIWRYNYVEVREWVKNCYIFFERLNLVVGEEFLYFLCDKDRDCFVEKMFDVVDIYNVFDKFDSMSYVEKYLKGEFGFEKMKLLIDKWRVDIEKELKEVICNLDKRYWYFLSVV